MSSMYTIVTYAIYLQRLYVLKYKITSSNEFIRKISIFYNNCLSLHRDWIEDNNTNKEYISLMTFIVKWVIMQTFVEIPDIQLCTPF